MKAIGRQIDELRRKYRNYPRASLENMSINTMQALLDVARAGTVAIKLSIHDPDFVHIDRREYDELESALNKLHEVCPDESD